MLYAVWAQTFILAVTACFVCWYTRETASLRRETVRQNEINLRPIVVPIFEEGRNQHVFKLRNVGAACAFNVRVQPIKHMFGQSKSHQIPHDTRFEPLDWLAPGETSEIHFTEFSNNNPVDGTFLQNKFFPARVTSPVTITIAFNDVEGGRYALDISVEPPTQTDQAPALQALAKDKSVSVKLGAIRRLK